MNRSRVTGDLASHGNIFVDIANDRVGIGSTIPGQKLSLPDSAAISLGNSADLRISFDVSNSIIRDHTGAGSMRIANNNNWIQVEPNFGQFAAIFKPAEQILFHSNALKFQTTAYGVNVTGTTDTDGLVVSGVTTSGNVTVSSTEPTLFLTDTDHNPDYKIHNLNGQFRITDATAGAHRLVIHSSGNFDVSGQANIQSGLNVSGGDLTLTGGDLTITDTNTDSAAGPEFKLFRNSASPADADYLGQIKFAGESDTGVERNYAKITGKILDASNGTEDGIIEFAHIKAGSQVITGRWRSDSLQLLNSTNFSVAGTSEFTGTATFSEALTLSKDTTDVINFSANSTSDKRGISFNGRTALSSDYNDGYLRLNNENEFTNGVYTPGLMRADGGIRVDANVPINSSGFLNASLISGALPAIDGSNLTGITQTTINSNADNRVITGSGTANTLNAESTLTYNGNRLFSPSINITDNGAGSPLLSIRQDDQNPWAFEIGNDTYASGTNGLMGYIPNNGDMLLRYRGDGAYKSLTFEQHDGTNNRSWATFGNGGNVVLHYQGNERFRTNNDGASITGDLSLSADDPTLTFIDTNNNNFRITANTGNLYIADATANQTRAYMSSGGAWNLQNNVTITKTGDPILTVTGSGHAQLTLTNTSGSDHCGVNFGDSSDHNAGMIQYTNNGDYMVIHTAGVERIRIKGDGKTQFSHATDNIIHTSSNSSRLRLFGGSNESVSNGAVLTLHGVNHSNNYADLAAATGGHIQFRVGTSEKLRITSGGNVGINEASNINGRLHVQHDALAENILYATRYNDQGNDKPILAITEAQMSAMANSGLVIGPHNRDMHIGPVFGGSANVDTNQVKGLRIDHAGRVGINTGTNVSHEYLTVKPIGDNVLDIAYRLNSSTDIRHKHYSDDAEYRGGFNYTRYSNSTRYPNLHHDHYWVTNPSGTSTQVSMRLTREGYLLQQYIPAFGVAQTTNAAQIASGVYVFNEVYFNNGNHYSSSNGRFTAPKAGAYFFLFSLQLYGGNAVHARFQINGSDVFQNGTSGPIYEDGPDSHETLTHGMVLNLAQGDYVHVARNSTTRGMQSSFCGHLLG